MKKLNSKKERLLMDIGYWVALLVPFVCCFALAVKYIAVGCTAMELAEAIWIALIGIRALLLLDQREHVWYGHALREMGD